MSYYPGNKGADGVRHKIINLFPPHDSYFEVFLGSGQILRHKKPAPHWNIGVEIDSETIAQYSNSYPSCATILQQDAIKYLEALYYLLVTNKDYTRRLMIYLDPPYPMSCRRNADPLYRFEMTDAQHRELLTLLLEVSKLPNVYIAISSYENPLYNELLAGWRKYTFEAMTHAGVAQECVYMNYPEPTQLHQYDYLGTDKTDRQRIKRKINRHVARLKELPPQERAAIIDALTTAAV